MLRKRLIVALLGLVLSINTVQAREAHEDAIKIASTYKTTASWYSHGRKTANGELFDPTKLTVAHKTLPFGTLVRLTNLSNYKSIIVRVNDRGPFIRGREFDITKRGAEILGIKEIGVSPLVAEVLEINYKSKEYVYNARPKEKACS